METITDWQALWKELVEFKKENHKESMEAPGDTDYWKARAREYNERVKIKWEKPDLTRDFILEVLEPNSSIIDIGAGTGSWSILFSKLLKKVTAIEPSKAMREVFDQNIKSSGISNIEVLPGNWQEVNVEPHDYVFCSHAMYGATDFAGFVQKMINHSRKMCFLLVRAPSTDGLITEACQHIWKQPHDSPNFTIAYNILIQMGIYANVQFEELDRKFFVANSSKDEAFKELKKKLGLLDNSEYDDYLWDLLDRRLIKQNNQYLWPGGVQGALIYWSVKKY